MWAIFSLVGFVLVVYAFTRPRGQRWRYVAGGVLAFLVAGLTAPAEVSQPPGLPEPPAMNAPQPQEQTQKKVEEPASGADATPVETLLRGGGPRGLPIVGTYLLATKGLVGAVPMIVAGFTSAATFFRDVGAREREMREKREFAEKLAEGEALDKNQGSP